MIEFDRDWADKRIFELAKGIGSLRDDLMTIAREAHERGVAIGRAEQLEMSPPVTDIFAALDIPRPDKPRTLFEDAALQEWVRLASESKPTDSGYYTRYTPDERVAEAIKAARAFVDAVREET